MLIVVSSMDVLDLPCPVALPFGNSSSQMLLKLMENSLLCKEMVLSSLAGASSVNRRESSKIIAGSWVSEFDDDDDTDNSSSLFSSMDKSSCMMASSFVSSSETTMPWLTSLRMIS